MCTPVCYRLCIFQQCSLFTLAFTTFRCFFLNLLPMFQVFLILLCLLCLPHSYPFAKSTNVRMNNITDLEWSQLSKCASNGCEAHPSLYAKRRIIPTLNNLHIMAML